MTTHLQKVQKLLDIKRSPAIGSAVVQIKHGELAAEFWLLEINNINGLLPERIQRTHRPTSINVPYAVHSLITCRSTATRRQRRKQPDPTNQSSYR
jgi:hypothetical protein